MNKNSNRANQGRFAAMRLAEINATDKEDLLNCASDMTKTASLNNNEAIVVAKAIRAKYLPNIAKQAGLDFSNLDLDHGKETVDFAKDESDDDDEDLEFHHFESDEDSDDENEEMSDDMSDDMEDEDEVEDSDDVATFEIEVPADMVDQAQKAVQEALDNLLGGDVDSEDDEDEITHFNDDDEDSMSDDDEDDETQLMKTSNEVRSMNKQSLAERKAQREALMRRAEREEILKKIASEEETYPASASFKYNEDLVNMEGEVDYPSMTMQSSEGNSLKEQNPTWAEQKVPTVNGDHLEFPSVTKPMKFEGSGDGSLEYTVDWDKLENPSEGFEDVKHPEVPTQMPAMPHKSTKSVSASKHDVECTACGTRMSMTEAEMEDDNTRCANKECPTNRTASDKSDEEESEDMERKSEQIQEPVHEEGLKLTGKGPSGAEFQLPGKATTVTELKASVDTARIKCSYSCATKLALAGIITSDEVDSYAEQMLNDGLKADSMIRQTKLLLKSAQSSTERVAAAAAERMSTRTASTLGVSTSPAMSGGFSNNSAALDIQSALKGTWTMPKIED
jgi:hypothetical protein